MNLSNFTIYIHGLIVRLLLGELRLLNYMDRQMLSTMRIPIMADVRELESVASFAQIDWRP
jgi:hypothetical protein